MNHFKVKNPRKDLSFEIAFTKAYRDAVKRYTHPAQIELACLRAQYPAILHPIQEEDLLAGRVEAGLVGLGIQGPVSYTHLDVYKRQEPHPGHGFHFRRVHQRGLRPAGYLREQNQ